MKIPLNSFEQYIDETILKRGFQYFKKGLVHEPEEVMKGNYESIVEGTEPHTVNLTIKNFVVTEYVCTCPYDIDDLLYIKPMFPASKRLKARTSASSSLRRRDGARERWA
jgi:hypothetical protein